MKLTFLWVKGNKKCVEQLITGSKNSHEENRIWPYSGKWLSIWRSWECSLERWLTKEGDGHGKIQAGSFSGQRRASAMVLGKKYREERIYLNLREEVWDKVFKVGSWVLFFKPYGDSWVFYAAEWYDLNFTKSSMWRILLG